MASSEAASSDTVTLYLDQSCNISYASESPSTTERLVALHVMNMCNQYIGTGIHPSRWDVRINVGSSVQLDSGMSYQVRLLDLPMNSGTEICGEPQSPEGAPPSDDGQTEDLLSMTCAMLCDLGDPSEGASTSPFTLYLKKDGTVDWKQGEAGKQIDNTHAAICHLAEALRDFRSFRSDDNKDVQKEFLESILKDLGAHVPRQCDFGMGERFVIAAVVFSHVDERPRLHTDDAEIARLAYVQYAWISVAVQSDRPKKM